MLIQRHGEQVRSWCGGAWRSGLSRGLTAHLCPSWTAGTLTATRCVCVHSTACWTPSCLRCSAGSVALARQNGSKFLRTMASVSPVIRVRVVPRAVREASDVIISELAPLSVALGRYSPDLHSAALKLRRARPWRLPALSLGDYVFQFSRWALLAAGIVYGYTKSSLRDFYVLFARHVLQRSFLLSRACTAPMSSTARTSPRLPRRPPHRRTPREASRSKFSMNQPLPSFRDPEIISCATMIQ